MNDDEFLQKMMGMSIDDYVEWEKRGYCASCDTPAALCTCTPQPEPVDDDQA